jgi:uncharacterized Tic20 family protein
MTEPAAQPAAAPKPPLAESEDKQWASLAHFGNIFFFLAPLVIWCVFRERGTKANTEGKEALNWGITLLMAVAVFVIISIIFGFIPVLNIIWAILSIFIWLAMLAANLIFAIMGGIKVNGGGSYRYPFAIRLIK